MESLGKPFLPYDPPPVYVRRPKPTTAHHDVAPSHGLTAAFIWAWMEWIINIAIYSRLPARTSGLISKLVYTRIGRCQGKSQFFPGNLRILRPVDSADRDRCRLVETFHGQPPGCPGRRAVRIAGVDGDPLAREQQQMVVAGQQGGYRVAGDSR